MGDSPIHQYAGADVDVTFAIGDAGASITDSTAFVLASQSFAKRSRSVTVHGTRRLFSSATACGCSTRRPA